MSGWIEGYFFYELNAVNMVLLHGNGRFPDKKTTGLDWIGSSDGTMID